MVQSVEHSVGDRCCFKTYQKERKAFGERILWSGFYMQLDKPGMSTAGDADQTADPGSHNGVCA